MSPVLLTKQASILIQARSTDWAAFLPSSHEAVLATVVRPHRHILQKNVDWKFSNYSPDYYWPAGIEKVWSKLGLINFKLGFLMFGNETDLVFRDETYFLNSTLHLLSLPPPWWIFYLLEYQVLSLTHDVGRRSVDFAHCWRPANKTKLVYFWLG